MAHGAGTETCVYVTLHPHVTQTKRAFVANEQADKHAAYRCLSLQDRAEPRIDIPTAGTEKQIETAAIGIHSSISF